MKKDELTFALSLAQKAGQLASGDYAVRSALKSGKTKLLLIACDAAPNTKKDLFYLTEAAGVPVAEVLTRQTLGSALGKGNRTAVAVLDGGFMEMIKKKIDVLADK